MEYLLYALIPIFTAFTNRIRGGLFRERAQLVFPAYGSTIARSVYGLSIALSLFALGLPAVYAATFVATIFLGHAIGPFNEWQYMQEPKKMVWGMSARGIILVGPSMVAWATFVSPWGLIPLFILGALMGPVYWVSQIKLPPYGWMTDHPTRLEKNDTSEVIYGALTGIAFVVAWVIQ